MKISEITKADVIRFLRIEEADADELLVEAILEAAKSYISSYTGLPLSSEDANAVTVDSYQDLSIAFLVLCQSMYDDRTIAPDTKYANSTNRLIDGILDVHSRNLL